MTESVTERAQLSRSIEVVSYFFYVFIVLHVNRCFLRLLGLILMLLNIFRSFTYSFFIIIIILEYFFPLFMCEHEHCHTNFPFTIKEFTLLLLYFEFIRKLVFYTQAV